MAQFLMARQPIYDRKGNVYAYELLYRSTDLGRAGVMDAEAAAQSLANTLVEVGLDRLAGDKLAFVNVDETLLHSDALLLLPKDRVIIELLETLEFTPDTRAGIERLLDKGYRLAFDDFIFEEKQFDFIAKVGLVKVDVLDTPKSVLRAEVPKLKKRGVKLLAEKVEDKAMHRLCMSLGFDFFQGYFYARPEVLSAKSIAPRHQVVLRLIAKLQNPDVSLDQIEGLITADVSLAFRLLRLVNSAAFGLQRSVSSVKVALAIIGLSKVQALATLLSLSSDEGETPELLATALIRGRVCENIATELGLEEPTRHFTVGLFSVLDALLGMPMTQILEHVPLEKDLADALTDVACTNELGRTLQRAIAFERADWAGATQGFAFPDHLSQFYSDAAIWARELEASVAA